MYSLLFVMVVLQAKIDHQLITVAIEQWYLMLYIDHLKMVVEKRNLYHQSHFHFLLL
jgi:hypothetical protein